LSILDLILFLTGLALLVAGAESLVRGATRLGRLAGLSPLVVGLTIVSFATTAPEASVSIAASAQGRVGLAVGNVLGSNIFNILVVAGAAATVTVVPVSNMIIRRDVPVLICATAFVYLIALDRKVAAWEGLILIAGLVFFVGYSVFSSRRAARATRESRVTRTRREALFEMGAGVVLSSAGAGLLVFGSRLFVDSASAIASALGVSELIIGLTIVAAGTSAPELATSLVAAFRKETDLAIGNAVGASIINMLGIIGLSSLVAKGSGLEVPRDALRLDFPVALSVAMFILTVALLGRQATRRDGMFMLGFYGAYLVALILISLNGDLLSPISLTVRVLVLPLIALAAVFALWRSIQRPGAQRLEPPFVDR
jgi:cation:H+ antiporter